MRYQWFLTLPLLWAASPLPQDAPQQAVQRNLRPAVVITGASSSVDEAGYQRLRSAPELARAWSQHVGKAAPNGDYDFFYNPAGVPEVDFVAFEVVAIFGGKNWNSAGFTMISVADDKDRRLVRFDHKSYQTEGPDGGGQRATPFGFFVLPRTDLPIVLEENVQSMIGDPPKWLERARL